VQRHTVESLLFRIHLLRLERTFYLSRYDFFSREYFVPYFAYQLGVSDLILVHYHDRCSHTRCKPVFFGDSWPNRYPEECAPSEFSDFSALAHETALDSQLKMMLPQTSSSGRTAKPFLHKFVRQDENKLDQIVREVLKRVPKSMIDSPEEFEQLLASTEKFNLNAWVSWKFGLVGLKVNSNYDSSEQGSMLVDAMANDEMFVRQVYLGFIDSADKLCEPYAKEKLHTLDFGHLYYSISCRHPDGCIAVFAPEKLVCMLGFLGTTGEAAVDRLETSVTKSDLPNSGFLPAIIMIGPLVRIGCLQNTSGAVKFHEHERFDVSKETELVLALHALACVERASNSNITRQLSPRVVGKQV
jgi:hypothetical protein